MKYNLKIQSFFMTTIVAAFLGLSSASYAVTLSDSCPSDHTMDMSGMTLDKKATKSIANHAEAECSNCHGKDGNGVNPADDVPNLAGQDFMYLCARLNTCRKQGKSCESHEDIAPQLSEHDVVDLAMFYAHLPSFKW